MGDNNSVLTAPDGDVARRWQTLMQTLRDGHASDFLIRCGDEAHAVHKAITTGQSKFFDRACFGPFKEAGDGVLQLPDDDPLAVRAMIDCLYLGNYTHTIMKSPTKSGDETYASEFLPLHAKVYVLGDKYEIESLLTAATKNITNTVKNDPDCVLVSDFRAAIDIVYENTLAEATGVRACFMRAIVGHPSCLDTEMTEESVRKHASLSFDLGMELRKRFKRVPIPTCPEVLLACEGCDVVVEHTDIPSSDKW